jgi:hypothetical protein
MPARDAKKLGKFAKTERKVTVATLSQDLRVYAVQRWPLDRDERRKARLATLLNMTPRRIRSFWEGEPSARPRGEEIERIEALIGQKEDAHGNAYEAVATRLAAVERNNAELRQEVARLRLALESGSVGGSKRARGGARPSLHGGIPGDQPFTDADERVDQSQGWGG